MPANHDVALDRAGITVFRDIVFLAAGPASERSRSAATAWASAVQVKEGWRHTAGCAARQHTSQGGWSSPSEWTI